MAFCPPETCDLRFLVLRLVNLVHTYISGYLTKHILRCIYSRIFHFHLADAVQINKPVQSPSYMSQSR